MQILFRMLYIFDKDHFCTLQLYTMDPPHFGMKSVLK